MVVFVPYDLVADLLLRLTCEFRLVPKYRHILFLCSKLVLISHL